MRHDVKREEEDSVFPRDQKLIETIQKISEEKAEI